MSSPFVTLTPEDPDYKGYLLGTFSKTERALPIESFGQTNHRSRVTFQIVPLNEICKPTWWKIYLKACRPELLGLTLGPFFIAMLQLQQQTHLRLELPLAFASAAVGLFFLHVACFLLNDFKDHMRGVDVANRRRGSQVIQRGWASAREVRGWAFVNAACALLCGLPALWMRWPILPLVALSAGLVGLALSWMSSLWAKRGISDLLVFFGLGPLLTGAAAITAFGGITSQTLYLGTAFGALAVLILQMRQMENLFRAGKNSFRTFIGAVEFDRAKTLVLSQALFIAVLQVAMATQIFSRWEAIAGFVFAIVPLGIVCQSLRRAASPLSSDLIGLGRRAIWAQMAILAWWGVAIWI